MSDFHDSDYYERQRIIAHHIIRILVKTSVYIGTALVIYVLIQAFKLPFNNWKTYNTVILFVGIFLVVAQAEFYRLNHELEVFDANVIAKKNKQSAPKTLPGSAQRKDHDIIIQKIASMPELVQAIADEQITEDGTLKVARSEFVLYCNEKGYFAPRNKEAGWKPIENILIDSRTNKPITAKQFRQSYQDLARDGKVPL